MKIKLSQVIDQALEMEIPLLGEQRLRELRNNYTIRYGNVPMENAEVPDAQLSTMAFVLDDGLSPYTDFAVWQPYGMRQETKMKFTEHGCLT